MKFNRDLPWNSVFGGMILAVSLTSFASRSHANVYATNLRLNGGTTNFAASANDTIVVSYVLNEPASLGTTLQLISGSTVVRSLFLPAGTQGTLRGLNEVFWDSPGATVADGTYSVAVLTASSGYTNWTQITSDTGDLNTYVADGRGIAVDRNQNSLYYGRVFVANASPGPPPALTPGDTVGILKYNADTSGAEEGISSAGLDGYNWSDGHVSPWKVEVSADDFVYVNDLANGGEVYRWDPTVSSNSLMYVLRKDNQPPAAALSGLAILGTGTNTQIWMSNTNAAQVLKWNVNVASVCVSNDSGQSVLSNPAPNFYDMALDNSGNIYACTYTDVSGDPLPRVFRFAANGTPSNPVWAVGTNDDSYAGASGIAVDPSGTYVAVAFEGPAGGFSTNGNTKVLYATNGAVAANLDLGVFMQNDANHDDTDCAWDAVGNIYYIDTYFAVWRAFSPPGTNQSTTLALATVQLSGGSTNPPPSGTVEITRITVTGGNVNIDFTAGTNTTVSQFSILGAATVAGPFTAVTTAQITQVGAGLFHATFPLGPSTQYFRISLQGGTQPPSGLAFSNVSSSGANMLLTFTGSASDQASAFTLLSSASANGTYSPAGGSNITALSPGVFQATVPRTGLVQFYRIRR